MNRLLVALLAAFDALIAAAVGVAAALAPLTVLWVLGLGGTADWGALWPVSVRLWQFGQLVPLSITLPPEYLTATGIPADAATFWISLAPLAFAAFTALFAARSGARAARSGAWLVGVASGALVTLVVAWVAWRTSANPVAAVYGWQALLVPTAVFALPALVGAIVGAWRHGDDGVVDAVRARLERSPLLRAVPEAAARGLGIAVTGFLAAGAAVVAVATVVRGGEVVALFESAHVDALGVVMLGLVQLAYLPTLAVWGGAFAAGPGFAVGSGTAVSPAGVELGVLPGIPALGLVPDALSPWALVIVLLIVAVGFLAGAAARRRLADADAEAAPRTRAVVLAIIVLGGAGACAGLAALAAGSIGPGRLGDVGPAAGPVAIAVGAELLVGAAIALFGPVRRGPAALAAPSSWAADGFVPPAEDAEPPADDAVPLSRRTARFSVDAAPSPVLTPDETETAPLQPTDLDPLATLGDPDGDRRA
ncbi:DUF6350 family protein [Microbacterium sp.]|uniref:cell division protein PerM n=1 Tax=Microbacterium sp. TaxID=51671 RepID=UPI0025F42441|nr:DUF6350 family protein [Microbacterium sp.]